jgi:hypothetical protein
MARKKITTLVDDLTGGPADETLTFALDGTTYAIDVSAANATSIRTTIGALAAKARRVAVQGRGATRSAGRPRRGGSGDTAALRAWARENGWPNLPSRGRIPNEILAASVTAQGGQAAGGAA